VAVVQAHYSGGGGRRPFVPAFVPARGARLDAHGCPAPGEKTTGDVTLGLQAATPDKPRYVPLIARQTLPGFHRWIEQEQSESRGQVLLCASG